MSSQVLAQRCAFVDLEGPLFQRVDCANGFEYAAGRVEEPIALLFGDDLKSVDQIF